MNEQQNLEYRHSGSLGASPVLLPLVGLAVGGVTALAYAYIIVYSPIIGYINILFLIGYSFVLGVALAMTARMAKCRNQTFLTVSGLGVALGAWYCHWGFFMFALLQRYADADMVPSMVESLHPGTLWHMVTTLNETGWYEIFGGTPSGIVLWAMWLIEGAIMILGPTLIASGAIDREMFCERCRAWCDPVETRLFQPAPKMLSTKSRPPHIAELLKLEQITDKVYPCIQAEVLQCAGCEKTVGLRYAILRQEKDDKGNMVEKSDDIPGIFQMPA